MNERILKFIEYLGISVSEFERSCNLSNGAVSKMGDNTRRSTIDKINNVYPQLNTDWLLTGKGHMVSEFDSATLRKRLMQYIDFKDMDVTNFETRIGLDNGFIKKMSGNINPFIIKKILYYYPEINKSWLLYGEGDMLNTEQSPSLLPTTDKVIADNDGNNQHIIKYYPNVNGSMGGVQFLDDPDETVCDITIPGYSDCKFAINAYGDSMYPLIKSGQIILMSEWLESFIDWGRIYLVVTKSGYRVIKRLYPGTSNATVTCKSENSETNPPFEIERDDILKVYLVKGWICRDAI
jgi:phage repressor protein C with HTH and peptisase S24 domain